MGRRLRSYKVTKWRKGVLTSFGMTTDWRVWRRAGTPYGWRAALEPVRLDAAVRAGEEAALERAQGDSDLSDYYLVMRGTLVEEVTK